MAEESTMTDGDGAAKKFFDEIFARSIAYGLKSDASPQEAMAGLITAAAAINGLAASFQGKDRCVHCTYLDVAEMAKEMGELAMIEGLEGEEEE
jgi:hypothetical protein